MISDWNRCRKEQATEDQISGGSYAIIISSASFLINFFQSIILISKSKALQDFLRPLYIQAEHLLLLVKAWPYRND